MEDRQKLRLYVLDSIDDDLVQLLVEGGVLYSILGEIIGEVSDNMTIGALKEILLRERILYFGECPT